MSNKNQAKPDKNLAQIEKLEAQLKNKESLYLRALADYQNLEKRIRESNQQQEETQIKFILLEFLTINDDMEKAVEFEKNPGLKLIKKKLVHIFERLGVKEIRVLKKTFSPDSMECVQTIYGKKDNLVVKVHQKGYFYKGQLLRPARVVVSKLKVSDSSELNH